MTTPFLPATPHPPPGRVVSPVNPIRPGYTQKAQTLPSRFSPGPGHDKSYSTDFSSGRSDGGGDVTDGGHKSPGGMTNGHSDNIRVSSTYTHGLQSATPTAGGRSSNVGPVHHHYPPHAQSASPAALANSAHENGSLNRSLPNMMEPLQASNVYPLHLLFTTNYRLPGDVDRCNLEKHLSDAEFDMVFRMSREDFYRMPYWRRCDMKRRYYLF